MTILITERDTQQLLSIDGAIVAIEDMFRMSGNKQTDNSERMEMPAGSGYLLFRAGALHARNIIGFKILSGFGSGPRLMWNHLYDIETGELLAMVQSRAISKLRTAAASAVAAKYLSPATADVLGMYGAGKQAETQLEAISRVRKLRKVVVYSRTKDSCEAFCRRMSEKLDLDVVPADTPEQVPAASDIVVTITNAEKPVLLGAWIKRPLLVCAVGANEWYERELDEAVIGDAKMVVVDDVADARRHSGDLLWAESKGKFDWKHSVELGDIVAGRVATPDFGAGTVIFESHGIGLEDVAIAAAAYDAASAAGLGTPLQL